MNHIVNIFNQLIPRIICSMNESELKDSASTLVNDYRNDLSIDFVHNNIFNLNLLLVITFQNSIQFMTWQNVLLLTIT